VGIEFGWLAVRSLGRVLNARSHGEGGTLAPTGLPPLPVRGAPRPAVDFMSWGGYSLPPRRERSLSQPGRLGDFKKKNPGNDARPPPLLTVVRGLRAWNKSDV